MSTKKLQIIGSVYQTDSTLTQSGKAADAKATGDLIVNISNLVGDEAVSDQINNAVENKVDKIDGKGLSTNDYTTTEKEKLEGIENGANKTVVDTSLSSTSVNPVQNKVIDSALSEKVHISRTINGKPLSDDITLSAEDVGADASGSATNALNLAKEYTDNEIAELINGAPTTLDTLGEIATAMETNSDVVSALNDAVGSKANASDLTTHTGNATVHITSAERTNWNAAKTHADQEHAPIDAEANQNAFSNIVVGDTTIEADQKTDSLTFVAGENVTLTPDATNDKITIAAKDTVYTHPTYTNKNSGLYKVTVDSTGHVSAVTAVTKSDITDLGIPGEDTNTTYSVVTQSDQGLMSADDKKKLDGVATGANKTVVDSALSTTSTNPVQNKVVTDKINEVSGLIGDTSVSSQISAAIANKSDTGHNHSISNITDLQSTLDGKAASSHDHSASNITSGTLDADRLPTVPISKGGTGATTAAAALTSLGAMPLSGGTFTGAAYASISYQNATTSLLRNSKLVSTETTPTVNGEICWMYE